MSRRQSSPARRIVIGHANSYQDPAVAVAEDDRVYAEALERSTQCKKAVALFGLHYSWRSLREELKKLAILPAENASVTLIDTWDPLAFHAELGKPGMRALLAEKGFGQFSSGTLQLAAMQLEPPFRTQAAWLLRDHRSRFTTYPIGGADFVGSRRDCNLSWRTKHLDHHLAHAAAAVYTSPFDECMVLVVDGFGEGHATSLYHFAGREFKLLYRIGILASLGLLFYRLTYLCGFDPAEGEEWKVMGLAAYGRPRAEIFDFFTSRAAAYHGGEGEHLTEADFEELETIAGGFRHHTDPDVLRAADLACNFQRYFEDAVLQLARKASSYGLSKNLAYGGGCALNSAANGRLLAVTDFERLHVPSAPGDDGNSLGAVLYQRHKVERRPRKAAVFTPYLGRVVDTANLEKMLETARLPFHKVADETALCNEVADLLVAGKIVGWMQGRAELGPRALGNRSILVDPRAEEMRDRINDTVKFREWYRPLAPAILHEFGPDYFEDYQESPYMERTLRFRREARARVPAVVHRDGTGRLQTVKQEWNPLFHRLLRAFYEKTGVPVLLNTSLNVMGKPIVHSEQDALTVFVFSALDHLAIGLYVIGK
jgi:carbamoyltransferase